MPDKQCTGEVILCRWGYPARVPPVKYCTGSWPPVDLTCHWLPGGVLDPCGVRYLHLYKDWNKAPWQGYHKAFDMPWASLLVCLASDLAGDPKLTCTNLPANQSFTTDNPVHDFECHTLQFSGLRFFEDLVNLRTVLMRSCLDHRFLCLFTDCIYSVTRHMYPTWSCSIMQFVCWGCI